MFDRVQNPRFRIGTRSLFAFTLFYAGAFLLIRVGIATDRASTSLLMILLGLVLVGAITLALVGYGKRGVRGFLVGAFWGSIATAVAIALVFDVIFLLL